MTRHPHIPTVLVADDEPEVLDLVRMLLEWEDYAVVEAMDGQEALEKIRSTYPDLALLDVRMPKMDGLSVLEHLQSDPGLAGIPVVMLSVVTTYPQVETALRQGAIAYLPKPFEIREIVRLVNQVLSSDANGRQVLREHALKTLKVER
jgi:CheY-like chemotaxis protein